MNRTELETLRATIIAQADDLGDAGWLSIPVPTEIRDTGLLRVPRGAFELWAVHRSGGEHLATPWKRISPVGVKQGADDPFHTDWMLGAGLDPRDMHRSGSNPYHEELSAAAYAARHEVEGRLLQFESSVLLQGPAVVGVVVPAPAPGEVAWNEAVERDGTLHAPILVLRSASAEWLPDVLEALGRQGAVVFERGGEMAHLVNEVRAANAGPLMRKPEARRLYPEGTLLRVESSRGAISLLEQARVMDAGIPTVSPYEEEVTVSDDPVVDVPEPHQAVPPASVSDEPPLTFTPTKESNVYGIRVLTMNDHQALHYMIPAYKLKGREFQAYASYQSGRDFTEVDYCHLVIHISPTHHVRRGPRSRSISLITASRSWTSMDDSILHTAGAVAAALYAVVPAEHPNSPETALIRQQHAEQSHQWWRDRSGADSLSHDALRERAKRMVAEEIEERKQEADAMSDFLGCPDDFLDAMAAYKNSARHHDEEFKRRGMSVRMIHLRNEIEDELDAAREMSGDEDVASQPLSMR